LTLDLLPSAWAGIAVAGGCGLLIGLERERRKQQLEAPEEAGIRSFAIVALGGALAQTMDQPLLVAVGGLAVGAMLAVSILRRRKTGRDVTSELALFVTYLVGVLCVIEPALGAAHPDGASGREQQHGGSVARQGHPLILPDRAPPRSEAPAGACTDVQTRSPTPA